MTRPAGVLLPILDGSPTRPRVLVVDADACLRAELCDLLIRAVLDAQATADAADALRTVAHRRVDVMLCDIDAPGLGGADFLRAVRERDLDLPVVLMTDAPAVESALRAIEYGAFRYLTKPLVEDALVDTLTHACHLREVARLRRAALRLGNDFGLQLGDRASLDAHFDKALDALWIAFQPIARMGSSAAFGYEALVRSDEPTLPGPRDLFDAAMRLGRSRELARAIRARVAAAVPHAPPDALVFVIVHPDELADEELVSLAAPLTSVARRVVLEITERSALDEVPGLARTVALLRERGFRIAIDDLGAGYAGLAAFAQLEPDIVKLDMALVRDIDRSPGKQRIVRGIVRLCEVELGVRIIWEGVETEGERLALVAAGVDLCQGYLFGRPSRAFRAPERAAAASLPEPRLVRRGTTRRGGRRMLWTTSHEATSL